MKVKQKNLKCTAIFAIGTSTIRLHLAKSILVALHLKLIFANAAMLYSILHLIQPA